MRIGRVHLFPSAFWRRFNEWEIFNLPVKFAFAIALWHVPDAVRLRAPLYVRMEDVAALQTWGAFLIFTALLVIAGFITGTEWPVRIGYALGTAFWLTLMVMSLVDGGSWTGIVFFAAFMLANTLRQGRLVYDEIKFKQQRARENDYLRLRAEHDALHAEVIRLRAKFAE